MGEVQGWRKGDHSKSQCLCLCYSFPPDLSNDHVHAFLYSPCSGYHQKKPASHEFKTIPGLSLFFQHIKEQRGLAGKSARSESGDSAPSCDFVTINYKFVICNLHSNCWVYFPLIVALCKTGFIFLAVALFKEHTL